MFWEARECGMIQEKGNGRGYKGYGPGAQLGP